jgi:hypothetical protein
VVTRNPSDSEVPQIVAAFGAADDALAQQVVAWTLEVANRDRAAHPVGTDDKPSRRR